MNKNIKEVDFSTSFFFTIFADNLQQIDMKKHVILAMACMMSAFATAQTYQNPVIDRSLPDPTVIKGADGAFYLYSTEDIRNVPIYKSNDLIHWDLQGTAFTNNTRPNFVEKGGIWAPDINRIGGKYVLFYSMSTWGGEWEAGIGRAVSDNPTGPFEDKGKLFRSSEIGIQNCIDPFYIEDNGSKYLFFGSFHGIFGVELTEDGLDLKPGAKPVQVAGTAYEGTYIHKRDGYYYLFASTGSCCEGVNSTYATVVGRSTSLFGPYVDLAGKSMLENRHELMIAGNDQFKGTGHNSEIVTDAAGQDWLFYHAVSVKDPKGRKLLMDQVHWVDGWPVVLGNQPSAEYQAPQMNK